MRVLQPLNENEVPANAMGASSSDPGTGNIDTFDPLLKLNNDGTYIHDRQKKQWMSWAELNGVGRKIINYLNRNKRLTK